MKPTSAFLIAMISLGVGLVSGTEGARAEGFVEIYAGGAVTPNTTATFDATGVATSRSAEFAASLLAGGRAGYWLDSVPWLGVSLTGGYYRTKENVGPGEGPKIQLDIVPSSLLLMLRYPLLKSSEFPGGQVYPYVGVGPAIFVTKLTTQLNQQLEPNKFNDTNTEVGADLRVGVNLFHPSQSWSVFAEYRFTYVGSSTFKDDIGSGPAEFKLDSIGTQSFLIGAGYHF